MATENEKINACILYLRSKGYEVHKRNDSRIGQWVAYKREGMEPILHGKVIADYDSCYCVRKKNGRKDWCSLGTVIKFFDNKKDCYDFR